MTIAVIKSLDGSNAYGRDAGVEAFEGRAFMSMS